MCYSPLIFLWAFHLLTWLVSRYTAHWTKAYTYNERLCCFGICFPWNVWFCCVFFFMMCSPRLFLHAKTEWLVNCSHLVWKRNTDCSCLFSRCSFTLSSPQLRGSLLPPCPFSLPHFPLSSHSEGPLLPSHLYSGIASHHPVFFSPSFLPFHGRSVLWMHSVAPSMKAWKNQTPDHPSTTSWHTPSLG